MFVVLVSNLPRHISLPMDGLLALSMLIIFMVICPIMTHLCQKLDRRYLDRTQPNGTFPECQSPASHPLIFRPLVMCMLNSCQDAQFACALSRRASYHGHQVNISSSISHPSLASLLTRLRAPLFVMKKHRQMQVA